MQANDINRQFNSSRFKAHFNAKGRELYGFRMLIEFFHKLAMSSRSDWSLYLTYFQI